MTDFKISEEGITHTHTYTHTHTHTRRHAHKFPEKLLVETDNVREGRIKIKVLM